MKTVKVNSKSSDIVICKLIKFLILLFHSVMNAQRKTIKTYNVTISKIFQIVVKLNEEQQQSLLRHAEALLFGDKRKGVRKTCNIPVNYASDNRVYSNHIRNISKGGVFIETQSPLVSGEEIYMTFRLDGFERALKVKGEITQTSRTGAGIAFKGVSPYIAEMIAALVKRMK